MKAAYNENRRDRPGGPTRRISRGPQTTRSGRSGSGSRGATPVRRRRRPQTARRRRSSGAPSAVGHCPVASRGHAAKGLAKRKRRTYQRAASTGIGGAGARAVARATASTGARSTSTSTNCKYTTDNIQWTKDNRQQTIGEQHRDESWRSPQPQPPRGHMAPCKRTSPPVRAKCKSKQQRAEDQNQRPRIWLKYALIQ
jgi:hypothetical protein